MSAAVSQRSTATTAGGPSHQNAFGRGVRRLIRARETTIFGVAVLIVVVTTIVNPNFLFSTDGWRDLLLTPAMLMLLAVGQAMVIITRSVDLSVGSVVGLTAYLTGQVFIGIPGIPILLVFLIGAVAGALLGVVNGALVALAKVPALVITLGTLYVYRGVNVLWTGSNQINPSQLPQGFLDIGTASVLGIPTLFLVAIVVVLVAGWYMRNKPSGRELYAIGSDPAAAELYGLRVRRRIFWAFVISGALAGLAGVLFTARYGTSNSQTGSGIELQAVGAAVIGGVAIFGGSGTVYGAAIGAFLLITISRALPILGVQSFWQQAVVGALIIGAIVLDRYLAVRLSRRLIAEREDAS
ncbi:ABC transporter permease [Curtobacterium sp. ZW137]|uniref:ABC transporter permease n=1 Tax=Curtobacterium sp. ZW137 TaxID=2485104 RepID=UPI000F4C2B29|nr:ABC transporter permease [Curtobacterium sp. ZW137]ROP60934.1 rhamnose transport system permease protein [Curtobacterium sp. ZW137]